MARILVIDDESGIRSYLRRVLEKAGHSVDEAPNGRAGMRAARSARPDLVITDLVMPEQEGIETIRELRRDWPSIKILAISGGGSHMGRDYLAAAGMLGADRTMRKPVAPADLVSVVETLL